MEREKHPFKVENPLIKGPPPEKNSKRNFNPSKIRITHLAHITGGGVY